MKAARIVSGVTHSISLNTLYNEIGQGLHYKTKTHIYQSFSNNWMFVKYTKTHDYVMFITVLASLVQGESLLFVCNCMCLCPF